VDRLVEQPVTDALADPQRRGSVLPFLPDILVHLRFKAGVGRIARPEQPIGCPLAPTLDVGDLHQLGVGELDAVPPLLPRDRDPGDRRRVAIEPVDPGHVEQLVDVARDPRPLVEAAGAERVDVIVDIAPDRLVGAASGD
jgi:hypothetical protein